MQHSAGRRHRVGVRVDDGGAGAGHRQRGEVELLQVAQLGGRLITTVAVAFLSGPSGAAWAGAVAARDSSPEIARAKVRARLICQRAVNQWRQGQLDGQGKRFTLSPCRRGPLCAGGDGHPEPAIRIEQLSKTYAASGAKPKLALDAVSVDVPRGQIFGLLGPNGAGKSTLINILAALVVKSSGKVSIWGASTSTSIRATPSARSASCRRRSSSILLLHAAQDARDPPACTRVPPRRETRTRCSPRCTSPTRRTPMRAPCRAG